MPDYRRIDADDDEQRPTPTIDVRCTWCRRQLHAPDNTLCRACLDQLEHERAYARSLAT